MTDLYDILKANRLKKESDPWLCILGEAWMSSEEDYKEYTGLVPYTFIGNGQPLISWMIKGNTVQNGTPSPDNPIQPQETGERTGNLWSGGNVSIAVGDRYNNTLIDLPTNTYTFKAKYSSTNRGSVTIGFYDENNSIHTFSMTQIDGTVSASYTGIITAIRLYSAEGYALSSSYSADFTDIMLNSGSEALPYEPYGIKIPISSANTTTPVYLSEVETTRQIKKLVLTGDETWQLWNGNYFSSVIDKKGAINTIVCSHFINSITGGISYGKSAVFGLKIAAVAVQFITSVSELKTWLATQYAAGAPVIVWYVLAEPETAVVNEPLRKIGDYADSISDVISIPTVRGENVFDVDTEVKPSEVYIKYKSR